MYGSIHIFSGCGVLCFNQRLAAVFVLHVPICCTLIIRSLSLLLHSYHNCHSAVNTTAHIAGVCSAASVLGVDKFIACRRSNVAVTHFKAGALGALATASQHCHKQRGLFSSVVLQQLRGPANGVLLCLPST